MRSFLVLVALVVFPWNAVTAQDEIIDFTYRSSAQLFDDVTGWQVDRGNRPHRLMVQLGMKLRQIHDRAIFEHLPIEENTGMVVDNLLANLAAHQAGLECGDIISKVDGKPIHEVADFVKAYEDCKNDRVNLEILHRGKVKKVFVSKKNAEQAAKRYRIGVHLEQIPKALAQHLGVKQNSGLYVKSVIDNTPAKKAGIRSGDILLNADGKILASVEILEITVQKSQGKPLVYKVLRRGLEEKIAISAEEDPNQIESLATNLAGIRFLSISRNNNNQAELQRLANAVESLKKELTKLREELKKK